MEISQLEPKTVSNKVINRVINFDPLPIYDNLEKHHRIDLYSRKNNISMIDSFIVKKDGFCDCGCGEILIGRQKRWSSEDCSKFAYYVTAIINGNNDVIRRVLCAYFDNWACISCGVMDIFKEQSNGVVVDCIHVDHILAVQNGGGGCWLSNYQLLCEDCHKKKTKLDNFTKLKIYVNPTTNSQDY